MRLDDYQWSRNPRGMHNPGVFRYNLNRYREIKAGWVKLVAADHEFVPNIPELLAAGITPIIRVYRPEFSHLPADAQSYADIQQYIQAGARWFELWNEPNLGNEWPGTLGAGLDPNNIGVYIAPMMDHWVEWAERVIEMGGYPAFIALAESNAPPHHTTAWLRNMMDYLREVHYQRFRRILGNGLWLASHPYIYNHFYQQIPGGGPLSARPPHLQNSDEGGWHFEYPYDPISQNDDPGRTVWGNTAKAPNGDPNGLIATGQAFMELLGTHFGGGVVPVVGTEGGIWPWPGPDDGVRVDDDRFPGVTWQSHAEATRAMFDWIASDAAPPWLFGVALWKEDAYWEGPHGQSPTVARLAGTPAPIKSVPPLDTGGTVWGTLGAPTAIPIPEGPGPVHGGPDHHFVILAADIPPDWFFQAAEQYWLRFRPVLIDSTALIPRLPYDKTLAVTVITPSSGVEAFNTQIRDRWPTIWYDVIIADTLTDLVEVLNQRVTSGRRFG
ncbi:MAG: hypothetical protein Kow0077_31740 [Anaerolineae bacterium]